MKQINYQWSVKILVSHHTPENQEAVKMINRFLKNSKVK